MIDIATLLATAILFGGMTFFSFGFAPVLFKLLSVEDVRPLLRGTFPYYYLVVIFLSAAAAVLAAMVNLVAAGLLAAIAASTFYARQILMPQINSATDSNDKKRFGRLHGLSVLVQLAQIGVAGWALVLLT